MKFPHLVQRLISREKPYEHHSGVDRWFECDYMGASEFEWGALPQALRDMREHLDDLGVVHFRYGVGTDFYDAWYVGPNQEKFREAVDQAESFFRDQLSGKTANLKEASYIRWAYGGDAGFTSPCRIDGWWALDGRPVPWAFFKKQAAAEKWLECLREKK